MKKEIFFAVLLGLSLGLIVTYGVYRATQADTQDQVSNIAQSTTGDQNSQSNETVSNLVINSPKDEALVDTKTIPVTGLTTSNSFVIVYVNETPYITTADQTGAFSISVDLAENSNFIGVYALNQDGDETTVELLVTYISQPLVSQTATPSGDTVDE